MEYRELGKTGIRVSELGLGCEGFVGKTEAETRALLDCAIAAGVNCLDLYSPDPQVRRNLGAALRGRRDGFVIEAHLCTAWEQEQYAETRDPEKVRLFFERAFTELGTDYIDIGMLHYVDSDDTLDTILSNGIMAYARELRAAGRIRALGLSSHNPLVALRAAETGLIDVLLFSVNPCYDLLPASEDCETLWADDSYAVPRTNLDPDRERLYETCQRLGVGITVMKAFGGGDLLTDDSPAGKALTVPQCLHYALTRPAVAAVMAGAGSLDELRAVLAYETASDAERDYAAAFASFPRMSWKGHCMYCGHCAPCPKSIDVAAVTKFYHLARAQGFVPETVGGHYRDLSHHAGECIACGACEKRCPFGVAVRENMAQAKKVFGY